MEGLNEQSLPIITYTFFLVFRETLEALLIVTTLSANMQGAYARYKRPLHTGVILAIVLSVVTWFLMQRILLYFQPWASLVSAFIFLLVVAILILTTNWFFHKTYWINWLARFHKLKRYLTTSDASQVAGFTILGFISVYREGFEIALFLQPFIIEAGIPSVLIGVILGLLSTGIILFLDFYLHRRMPYRKILILTGIAVGFVLVVLVGQTVKRFQELDLLKATTIESFIPLDWLSAWFGVFPTWEGGLLQLATVLFVIGSYYVAEFIQRRKRLSLKLRRH